ncbi:hypothetical protein ACH4U5_37800 [Streptomyces sp. NPDC020858]|uniref:hypothetical protein n=1 Tax=Streptomyces sp. NPDC020858 TaxID=3365097 RepID=UPI0037B61FCE
MRICSPLEDLFHRGEGSQLVLQLSNLRGEAFQRGHEGGEFRGAPLVEFLGQLSLLHVQVLLVGSHGIQVVPGARDDFVEIDPLRPRPGHYHPPPHGRPSLGAGSARGPAASTYFVSTERGRDQAIFPSPDRLSRI